MPDAGAGKSIDDINTKPLGGSCGLFHFLGGTFIDTCGVAIAPDVVRQNRFMAFVDQITNGLPDQMQVIAGPPSCINATCLRTRSVSRMGSRQVMASSDSGMRQEPVAPMRHCSPDVSLVAQPTTAAAPSANRALATSFSLFHP